MAEEAVLLLHDLAGDLEDRDSPLVQRFDSQFAACSRSIR